jgi:hypothetical protein
VYKSRRIIHGRKQHAIEIGSKQAEKSQYVVDDDISHIEE